MNGAGESVERRAHRRVGSTLRGKYRIEQVIGVGGMAAVYRAVHRNGHRVAIKILHPETSLDDDMRARFVREGYAANTIEHPGVVRILDDDEAEDGAIYLVMELLEGETLHSRALRYGGRLGPRETLAVAYQLLGVVSAAHAKGILHRDIKPENLFLTRSGLLKVLDFGIARMQGPAGSDPTRTGRPLGTPAFMPPEQAMGRTAEIDVRSDVWSCGATLFSLLTGRRVHEAQTTGEQLVYAATLTARKLSEVLPETPPEIAALIDRALAFDRDARWPTAAAMQEAIADVHAALYGAPVSSGLVVLSAERMAHETQPTLDAPSQTASIAVRSARPNGMHPDVRRRKLVTAGIFGAAVLAAIAIASILPRPASRVPLVPALPDAHALACASNLACASQNAVCRAGACVPLASEDCAILARPEDVVNDSTVWLGAMFATRGPMAAEFEGTVRVLDLARRDFMDVANGLPGARRGDPPRPIGVVVCDDEMDAARAAKHLVRDLHVPAIIGFSRSKDVMDLTSSTFAPNGVLAMAAANRAVTLSSVRPGPGEPRLVWRTAVSAQMRIPVVANVVETIVAPDVRKEAPRGEPLRVLLVRMGNPAGQSYSDALVTALGITGAGASASGDRFHEIVLEDRTEAGTRSQIERRMGEVLAYHPHVILDIATHTSDESVPLIEKAWPKEETPRPRYVLSSSLAEREPRAAAEADPSLVRRVLGVEMVTSTPAVAKLVLRYNGVFTPKMKPQEVTLAPYDAFYVLAYAIASLGEAPITGSALARAFPRLAPPGARIDVGPGGIITALDRLARGENVDLQGTATSLDFDPSTGDAAADLGVFCLRKTATSVEPAESGLVWDPHAHKLVGQMRCN